jgi:hypothetical protein
MITIAPKWICKFNLVYLIMSQLKKIACNATNSAAIDDNGNLWVWGSTRYGLCGLKDEE